MLEQTWLNSELLIYAFFSKHLRTLARNRGRLPTFVARVGATALPVPRLPAQACIDSNCLRWKKGILEGSGHGDPNLLPGREVVEIMVR